MVANGIVRGDQDSKSVLISTSTVNLPGKDDQSFKVKHKCEPNVIE